MAASLVRLQGNDWQDWANQLLTLHYGPTEYLRVPDKHKGDAGIEGFALDKGHVYQSYGCEEPIGVAERYDKQRTKMTIDTKKFIDNKKVLTKLFGNKKISRWVLFVPLCDSKELIVHANKKTAEIKAEKLPYVASDFEVTICDEGDFAIERKKLMALESEAISIAVDSSAVQDVDDWAEENDKLIEVIDEKVAKLKSLKTPEQRVDFRNKIIRWHIEGQDILDALKTSSPTTYEAVINVKSRREKYLVASALASTPADQFKAALNELQESFRQDAKQLSKGSSEDLAYEAVADWMIRCPLDLSLIHI